MEATRVVPLVGTWIEITRNTESDETGNVVPLVGTWIEINIFRVIFDVCSCRSPCGNVD